MVRTRRLVLRWRGACLYLWTFPLSSSFVDYIILTENVAPTGSSSRGDE